METLVCVISRYFNANPQTSRRAWVRQLQFSGDGLHGGSLPTQPFKRIRRSQVSRVADPVTGQTRRKAWPSTGYVEDGVIQPGKVSGKSRDTPFPPQFRAIDLYNDARADVLAT